MRSGPMSGVSRSSLVACRAGSRGGRRRPWGRRCRRSGCRPARCPWRGRSTSPRRTGTTSCLDRVHSRPWRIGGHVSSPVRSGCHPSDQPRAATHRLDAGPATSPLVSAPGAPSDSDGAGVGLASGPHQAHRARTATKMSKRNSPIHRHSDLVPSVGLLVAAELGQVDGEASGGGEGAGVILAEDPAATFEGVGG